MIKPILEEKLKLGEKLKAAWYFEKWWEKAIIIVLGILGLFKIMEFLL